MQTIFIKIETTLEKAMYYRNSPQMAFYSFYGVHLQPNKDYPYTQITQSATAIEIEDYAVDIFDMCDNLVAQNVDWLTVVDTFSDINGTPQVVWQILNAPDLGDKLIYFRIKQGANDFFYSSPFKIYASDYVSDWHYYDTFTDTMLSTALPLWFKQYNDIMEIGTYDKVSLNQRVNTTTKLIEFEIWQFNVVDIMLFRLFKAMFLNNLVYCDFARTSLFEPFDMPILEGRENFADVEVNLNRNESELYDPFYVAPNPPPPPPYSITLTSVLYQGKPEGVVFNFTYDVFTPTYFIYEWSEDGITWTQSSGDFTSPHFVTVLLPLETDFYYRISYPPLDLYSNVVQLEPQVITIDNITYLAPSNYTIAYSYSGFALAPGVYFRFEGASASAEDWVNLDYATNNNNNPKQVVIPSAAPTITRVRVWYPNTNTYSDPVNLP